MLSEIEAGEKSAIIISKKSLEKHSYSNVTNTIMETLPQVAVNDGIIPSKLLKQNIHPLIHHARKHYLINTEYHGFRAHVVSWLSSLEWLTRWKKPEALNKDFSKEGVDKTDQILSAFEYYVENDDFDSAVRIINQSSGEVRRIFHGWITEARALMETEQILHAVKAVAFTDLAAVS